MSFKNFVTGIISLVFFISCGNHSAKHSFNNDSKIESRQKVDVEPDSGIHELSQTRVLISGPLLSFASLLDSAGYACDTQIKRKNGLEKLMVDKFTFFELPVKESSAFDYAEYAKGDTLITNHKLKLDLTVLTCATGVLKYCFLKKKVKANGWVTTYGDGYVEEWSFKDSLAANTAAIALVNELQYIYINVGAFVCCLNNKMYIFSSRASLFMYYILPFYKKFVVLNKAINIKKSDNPLSNQ